MWPDHSCNVGIIKEMAEVLKVTTRIQTTKHTERESGKDRERERGVICRWSR